MQKKRSINKMFLAIIGILLAIIFVAPILILVNSSFKTLQEIYIDILALPEHFSFQNYLKAFEKMDFSSFVDKFTGNYLRCNSTDFVSIIYGSMGDGPLQNKSKQSIIHCIFSSTFDSISMCNASTC